MDSMQTEILYLKGVGPERSRLLKEELNIKTFQDLLHFFPNRYIDRSRFHSINKLPNNNVEVQIKGIITSINYINQKRGKRMVANFQDGTGSMQLVWFRGYQWLRETIRLNQAYVIFGRINWFKGQASIPHPEMELESIFQQGVKAAFYPIYPSSEKLINKGISQRVIQKLLASLLQQKGVEFSETLPNYLLDHFKLISKEKALHQVHYPSSQNLLSRAQMRLKFEEFFYMQLQLILKNHQRKQKIKGHVFAEVGSVFRDFFDNHLPFTLTKAQKRVVKEIRNDLGTGRQMNRLLQGDVGSGKTIVALLSMLITIDNGFQSTLVAPTEILAQQHFHSLEILLKGTGIKFALLTGSSSKKERMVLHEHLESGKLSILVGTHAVFEDKVKFSNLG